MNRLNTYILLYTIMGCSMSTNNTSDQINKDIFNISKLMYLFIFNIIISEFLLSEILMLVNNTYVKFLAI